MWLFRERGLKPLIIISEGVNILVEKETSLYQLSLSFLAHFNILSNSWNYINFLCSNWKHLWLVELEFLDSEVIFYLDRGVNFSWNFLLFRLFPPPDYKMFSQLMMWWRFKAFFISFSTYSRFLVKIARILLQLFAHLISILLIREEQMEKLFQLLELNWNNYFLPKIKSHNQQRG